MRRTGSTYVQVKDEAEQSYGEMSDETICLERTEL